MSRLSDALMEATDPAYLELKKKFLELLKKKYSGTKFVWRKKGNGTTVEWENGPDERTVETLYNKFFGEEATEMNGFDMIFNGRVKGSYYVYFFRKVTDDMIKKVFNKATDNGKNLKAPKEVFGSQPPVSSLV